MLTHNLNVYNNFQTIWSGAKNFLTKSSFVIIAYFRVGFHLKIRKMIKNATTDNGSSSNCMLVTKYYKRKKMFTLLTFECWACFASSAFKSNQLKVGLHKRVRSLGHAILNLGLLSGLMSQKAKVGTSMKILIGYWLFKYAVECLKFVAEWESCQQLRSSSNSCFLRWKLY